MLVYDDISNKGDGFKIKVYCDGRLVGMILKERGQFYFQADSTRERSELFGSLRTLQWSLEG